MIPLNPRLKLVLGLTTVGALGALQALAKVEPAWAWVSTVVQLLTLAEMYVTVPAEAKGQS